MPRGYVSEEVTLVLKLKFYRAHDVPLKRALEEVKSDIHANGLGGCTNGFWGYDQDYKVKPQLRVKKRR